MTLYNRLILPENLYFAWQKAKRLYHSSDGYYFRGELSEFELNLEQKLAGLRKNFESGRYPKIKLRPLPRPKKMNGDQPIDRQYYHVSVKDQVAWIAIVNALGPFLDREMPSWSYGNRLYRPAWYETEEKQIPKLEIGPYRHSSGHLYRKFQHSWPLFRRHVSLTAHAMAKGNKLNINKLDDNDKLAMASAETEKLRYLEGDYWSTPENQNNREIYHASIDLKQFYPKINVETIMAGLDRANPVDEEGHEKIRAILSSMLRFRIDNSGYASEMSNTVEPPILKTRVYGLPTGLFVSGFLANIAMHEVDKLVEKELDKNKSIAHFRFVDDHTILAMDFDQLCKWVKWYEELLDNLGVGPKINQDKTDPPSLGKWIVATKKDAPTKPRAKKNYDLKQFTAISETKLDGENPTKLMTKTLTQVSAIAATDIHILDDEDLQERLKMLEWLLLANISEHEIRPDTRAAFAASQIVNLVQLLVKEEDELLDTTRRLAHLEANCPKPQKSTAEEIDKYYKAIKHLNKNYKKNEKKFLRRYFRLLVESFLKFPGKARLFFRLLQYCRITGFRGLSDVQKCIENFSKNKNVVWTNYYAGLLLQILGQNTISCTKTLTQHGSLRSDQSAALNHIKDLTNLDLKPFLDDTNPKQWFYNDARIEFGVSMLVAAKTIENTPSMMNLAKKLKKMGGSFAGVSFDTSHEEWVSRTGRSPGVWAFQFETIFDDREKPSQVWKMFSGKFRMSERNDMLAVRFYPEELSDEIWDHILKPNITLPQNDSGWILEATNNLENRQYQALASGKIPFRRAAKSTEIPPDKITLQYWVNETKTRDSFDPRIGEWTALEIIRQLITPKTNEFSVTNEVLDHLHPHNILLPVKWLNDLPDEKIKGRLTWEEWRNFITQENDNQRDQVEIRDAKTLILDYRFQSTQNKNMLINPWNRRVSTVGFLLLGLLRKNIKLPRIWNIRGNENIFKIPYNQWYQSLAISSPTLLLIESCISARTAESRSITRFPDLFGHQKGTDLNDTKFDPPRIADENDLVNEIIKAQQILVDNQISVSLNRPRQLIPFRISDFAIGNSHEGIESAPINLE